MTERGGPVLAGLAGDVGAAALRRLDAVVGADRHDLDGLAVGGEAAYAVCDGFACAVAGRLDGRATDAATAATLAAAATREDEAILKSLRGEFLVAVWDGIGRRGFVAVDHLGARSLYWCKLPGGVAFAADLRDLLALLPALPAPARPEVLRFASVGAWTPGATMFSGVGRLPGGGLLRLGSRPRVERHWEPCFQDTLKGSFEELAEVVRERVVDAVRRRLPAHGPSGLLLSGGLDSATVGAAARRSACLDLRAYSGVFPAHPEIDEDALIECATRWLDARSVRSHIRGGRPVAGTLEHIAAWWLPSTAPNGFLWSPLFRRAAEDGTRVLLDGQGGDELFGAVPYLLADCLRGARPRRARAIAARLPGVGEDPTEQQLARLIRHYALPAALPWRVTSAYRRLRAPGRYAPPYLAAADAKCVRALADPWRWTRRQGPRWWAHLAHTLTEEREALDVQGFLHRRARQFGLRDAHPFLEDLGLIELALRLPPEARFHPRHDRPLVRAAMRGLLPEELRLSEGKSRFTALLSDGLRGPDAAIVDRLLRRSTALIAEYVDHPRLVRELLDTPPERYARGRLSWAPDTWRATSLEAWLRELSEPGWAANEGRAGGPAVDQDMSESTN